MKGHIREVITFMLGFMPNPPTVALLDVSEDVILGMYYCDVNSVIGIKPYYLTSVISEKAKKKIDMTKKSVYIHSIQAGPKTISWMLCTGKLDYQELSDQGKGSAPNRGRFHDSQKNKKLSRPEICRYQSELRLW